MKWGEQYLYNPTFVQKILSTLLLPISFLYCLIGSIRYRRSKAKNYGIPIISIGNLIVGGSGKTPIVSELARYFKKPAIVLRGYGRQSRGMVVVKDRDILCDTHISGDEAMVYAINLPHAVVIVSEIRERGIAEAKAIGCDIVLLDDGYGKHGIQKLDIIIDVKTPNPFCLPSGPYREMLWRGKEAIVIREGEHFRRHVRIANETSKMVLVTGIARPERLDPYLPEVIEKYYFEDHHPFTQGELEEILLLSGAESLLVTQKDFVKMSSFHLNLSIMELSIDLDQTLIHTVKDYANAAQN